MLEIAVVSDYVAHVTLLRVDHSEIVLAVPIRVVTRELPTLEVAATFSNEALAINLLMPYEMHYDSSQKIHINTYVHTCVVQRRPFGDYVLAMKNVGKSVRQTHDRPTINGNFFEVKIVNKYFLTNMHKDKVCLYLRDNITSTRLLQFLICQDKHPTSKKTNYLLPLNIF